MYAGKRKTNSNLAWHRPQSEGCRLEEELMHKCRDALQITKDPAEKLRLLCLARGVGGILQFGRIFRDLSEEDNNELRKEDFKSGLKHTGLDLSDEEADALFAKLDHDGTGYIKVDDLVEAVRPPMPDNRRSIIEQAFRKLDKHNHGAISIQEIRNVYSVTSKSSFTCGDETAELILARFLAHFDTDGIEAQDERVTLEEFLNYYSGISVSVENDCNFDLMMRQIYKL